MARPILFGGRGLGAGSSRSPSNDVAPAMAIGCATPLVSPGFASSFTSLRRTPDSHDVSSFGTADPAGTEHPVVLIIAVRSVKAVRLVRALNRPCRLAAACQRPHSILPQLSLAAARASSHTCRLIELANALMLARVAGVPGADSSAAFVVNRRQTNDALQRRC